MFMVYVNIINKMKKPLVSQSHINAYMNGRLKVITALYPDNYRTFTIPSRPHVGYRQPVDFLRKFSSCQKHSAVFSNTWLLNVVHSLPGMASNRVAAKHYPKMIAYLNVPQPL
jgi:hypothetical protein